MNQVESPKCRRSDYRSLSAGDSHWCGAQELSGRVPETGPMESSHTQCHTYCAQNVLRSWFSEVLLKSS